MPDSTTPFGRMPAEVFEERMVSALLLYCHITETSNYSCVPRSPR